MQLSTHGYGTLQLLSLALADSRSCRETLLLYASTPSHVFVNSLVLQMMRANWARYGDLSILEMGRYDNKIQPSPATTHQMEGKLPASGIAFQSTPCNVGTTDVEVGRSWQSSSRCLNPPWLAAGTCAIIGCHIKVILVNRPTHADLPAGLHAYFLQYKTR